MSISASSPKISKKKKTIKKLIVLLDSGPIFNESGVTNRHQRWGLEKLFPLLCQPGRQILIQPKSAYLISISKGSNAFNFHEIGYLLAADLDAGKTEISAIGFFTLGEITAENMFK